MKNQPIKETEDFQENIDKWAYEDILQLANHFHRLDKDTYGGQFERTSDFVMEKKEGVPEFESIKTSIKRLRIYLALAPQDKEKFTFFPVLEAQTNNEEVKRFKLDAIEGGRKKYPKNELVPKLFKDIISRNWDVVDINLIDDLFVATKVLENDFDVVQRVKYYEIYDENILKVIQKLPKLTGITLYSGIDMNKFGDKTQVSFTPVLGFQYEESVDTTNFSFGLKNVLEFSKGEILVEYARPCPPTC